MTASGMHSPARSRPPVRLRAPPGDCQWIRTWPSARRHDAPGFEAARSRRGRTSEARDPRDFSTFLGAEESSASRQVHMRISRGAGAPAFPGCDSSAFSGSNSSAFPGSEIKPAIP